MTQLLIQGAAILAVGPFVETDDEISATDGIWPKHVMDGWQIVEVELPDGFTPAEYLWQGGQLVKKEPVVPPAPPQVRHITKLAFRNRFTQSEKVAVELAALDNPAGTIEERTRAAMLRANMADTAAATFIDLGRLDTRAGVEMLETSGLLAPGRAAQILDAPIDDSERPLP